MRAYNFVEGGIEVPRKAKAKGEEKEMRLRVRVLGSPSPEALRQAYRIAAKKLVRELMEKCGLQSTSE